MARLRTAATRTLLACLVASVVPGLAIGSADAAAASEVSVTGTVLVAPAEREGDAPAYAVQTDDGALVEVTGGPLADARPGSRFAGRLAAPTSLSRTDTTALLAEAEQRHVPLRVVSATLSPPEPAPQAKAGVTHRWYAAAPNNFGAQGMTDTALLDQLDAVAGYWTSQANGAIAGITTPTAITRYAASATTTGGGCGLTGSSFWAVVQEAAAKFPTANFDGTDQLLVLMPTTCSTGGTTGRGTVGGLSFGNGGYSISVTNAQYFEPTVAHELGHNYGYGHARLGPCTPCASEYGDYYSVMGAAIVGYLPPTALSTPYRVMQGVTDAGEIETLTGSDVTTTLTRTLQPRSASSGLRGLAIPDAATGRTFYVDYRSGTGTDAGSYYAANGPTGTYRRGVVVEEVDQANGTALLPDAGRNALVAGDSRTLPGGHVALSVTAIGGGTATVEVTIDGLPAYPTPGTVTLSRTPVVGVPVSAVLAGWSPAPAGVRYTWYADGAAIAGGASGTLTPWPGLVGRQLSVTAVASAPGYAPAPVSSASQVVAPGTLVVATNPEVTGSPVVGSTLHCTSPTFQQSLGAAASSTRWRAGGTVVAGATGTELAVTPDLLGAAVSCLVTVSASGYQSITVASATTSPVVAGTLTTAKPTIAGTPRVGAVLRARTGTWSPGTTFGYRWYADGRPIAGADRRTLEVTADLRGLRLKVRVTGRQPGYVTESRRSLGTRPVTR